MAMPAALYAGYDALMLLAYALGAATALNLKEGMNQMQTINIKTSGRGRTVLTLDDGYELTMVKAVSIEMLPASFPEATITMHVGQVDLEAHAIFSIESLREMASYHGFKLVPLETEG